MHISHALVGIQAKKANELLLKELRAGHPTAEVVRLFTTAAIERGLLNADDVKRLAQHHRLVIRQLMYDNFSAVNSSEFKPGLSLKKTFGDYLLKVNSMRLYQLSEPSVVEVSPMHAGDIMLYYHGADGP